ncbi:TIGR03936 family radical SAM-associated protein [Enterocloster sp.]|uniref:TIGR03936 family radical SAM-associated protein n=1 Tax=Enterocloster sp. TaxID=2719315 RepID=UPI003AB5E2B7
MKIRIKFRKTGIMKFIGHLDVMRYFQKAIRRADVEICYSGGFSPHQIMSFAPPLGVGITSNGEYVDIEVHSTGTTAEMLERLNAVMAEGFEIAEYKLLPDTAANAMSSVAAADYTLTFRPGYEPEEESAEEWFKKLTAFFDQPQVMVLKKTKKGEKEMDLKPLIYDLGVIAGNDAAQSQLFMKISTGSASNIKPELLLDAYYEALGKERSPFAFMVQREEVYADQASEHEREQGIHSFIPLGALGQDIE